MGKTIWVKDEFEDFWECMNCKLAWQFIYSGPQENELRYCPRCGYQIVEFDELAEAVREELLRREGEGE